MKLQKALDAVHSEYLRASSLHSPMASAHEGHSIIQEEYEELWEEIKKKHPQPFRLREEAVQLAAMAIRFLVDIVDMEE